MALMTISVISFSLKTILQILSAIPLVTNLAFNDRYLVIAYIHMVFIGFISLFLFAYLSHLGWYNLTSVTAKSGIVFLVSGFAGTELLLISQALNVLIPDFTFLIFLFSFIMATGLVIFIISQFNFKQERHLMLSLPILQKTALKEF